MTVFINGRRIKEIFVRGRSIGTGYSSGEVIFSKKQGWQEGTPFTLTVNSANNNSISGFINFNRYDYYEGGVVTENYYEYVSSSFSRASEGVVSLALGADTLVVYGDSNNKVGYYTGTSGTIVLSASEVSRIFQLKATSGVLELGSSMTVTSQYLEPIWDMSLARLGTSLYVNTGWAISSTRISRLALTNALTLTAADLGITTNGVFPVFAVGGVYTEATVSSVTSANTVHFINDTGNMRHLGWVTVSNGEIIAVESLAQATGSNVTKSISGANLNVTEGYGVDTDGVRVRIPAFTYNYQAIIDAAQSTTTEGDTVEVSEYDSGTSTSTTKTTSLSNTGSLRLHTQTAVNIPSPCNVNVRVTYSGYKYVPTGYHVEDSSGNIIASVNTSSKSATIPLTSGTGTKVMFNYKLTSKDSTTGNYIVYPANTTLRWSYSTSYAPVVVTPGTTQTAPIYAKVTRNQNDNNISVSVQTSTGDSSPYVSYILIGTLTVQANASTGTIS